MKLRSSLWLAGLMIQAMFSLHAANFTLLHTFNGGNNDGINPYGGLLLSGSNTLYGTAIAGGTNNTGVVFALNTNGMGFTVVHTFFYVRDGAYPLAGLVLSGNTLYGTTSDGGTNYYGTIFAVNTNGMGFTVLHSFSAGTDGGEPSGTLILSSNTALWNDKCRRL